MGPAHGGLAAATRRRVAAFIDEQRAEHDIPGASVAVVDQDGVLYAAGQGARDLDARRPATADTRYPFASVSKLVTATAVLQLVDGGELALDDEIRGYVPLWADVPGEPITVEELLTHSSGMPADQAGARTYLFADEPPSSPLVTMEDLRRHADAAADERVVDEERFMYSDRGYQVLGLVVEAVTGQGFAEVVRRNVFNPLGMDRSTVGHGPLAELDDAITGYRIEDGAPAVEDYDLEGSGLGPAVNGVLAPVTEMGTLVRCLLSGGTLDGTRVLDEDLVSAMCRQQVTTRETIDGDRHGLGYGPRVQSFLGEPYVYHGGTAPGVGRAYAGWLPERGLGVVLGVNTPDLRIGVVGQGVLAILADEAPADVVPYLRLRRKVRAVAGTYESARGDVTVTVEPAGSDSYIEVSQSDWTFPAFPESSAAADYAFYSVWAGGWRGRVEFHETAQGLELRMLNHRLHRSRGSG